MLKKLLYLNGIAIFMVVINHAVWFPLDASNFWYSDYAHLFPAGYVAVKPWMSFAARLIMFITHSSVPIFIFTTGVFCVFSFSNLPLSKAYRIVFTRLKTIVIPYAIWSIITSLYVHIAQGDFSPLDVPRELLTGTANYTYYYIIQLIEFYLLAPILVRLIKQHPLPMLLGSFLLQALFDYLIITTTQIQGWRVDVLMRLFPYLIFYFTLGVFLGQNLDILKSLTSRWRWLFAVLAGLGLLTFIPEATFEAEVFQTWIFPRSAPVSSFLFASSTMVLLLSIENWHPRLVKALVTLGQAMFAIFLMHFLVVFTVNGVVHRLIPILIGLPPLYFLVSAIAGLSIPLMLRNILHRSPLRRYSTYIFG